MSTAYFYAFLALLCVLLAYFTRRSKSPVVNLALPPGPKPFPIIGNILDIPHEFVWETYDKWFKEFQSDVVYVHVAGTSMVIVNTYEAALELLERRSALYSSRVRLPMLELMRWDFIGTQPYGEKWRSYRRLFHQAFNVNTTKQFESRQLKATHQLLLRIMDRPGTGNLIEHFRHMAGSFIMDIIYGINVLPDDDPYINLAEKAMRGFGEAMVPGRFWVDLFPWLKYVPKWFPGAGFRLKAEQWAEATREMIEKPFEVTKQNINEGQFTPSFTSHRLEIMSNDSALYHDEKTLREVAGVSYASSVDTTVTTLSTFVLAMLQHPEVQKRAQVELDRELNGNLPSFADQESLPYITAIVYETLRWRPVVPFVSHCVISDDIYKGYRVPAGSMVVPNMWSMFYDEEMYPDPTNFNPDRFLKNGKLDPAVRDPRLIAFGFGRRICPGRYTGYSSVWITVASMLATMDIKTPLDQDGKAITPSGEYISRFIHGPKPFLCSVTARSTSTAALVRSVASRE